MTSAERHYRFRYGMTFTVAFSHLILAMLGIYGRLVFSVPSRYPLLLDVMGNNIWIWLHAAVGAAVGIALLARRAQVSTLSASTGIMGAWSFLSLLWGLSTIDNPVSLAGPMMGGIVTVLSFLLTQSWARAGDREVG